MSSDRGIVLGHCFTCSRHTGILREIAKQLSFKGFMDFGLIFQAMVKAAVPSKIRPIQSKSRK